MRFSKKYSKVLRSVQPPLVNCTSRRSLYLSLAFCVDQHPSNREMGRVQQCTKPPSPPKMDISPSRIDVLVSRQPASGKCRKVDTKWEKKLSDKIGQFVMKRQNISLFCRWSSKKQDPVSTMQKTGWTIHSSFLVLSVLEKGFTLDVITRGQSPTIFLCIRPLSCSSYAIRVV